MKRQNYTTGLSWIILITLYVIILNWQENSAKMRKDQQERGYIIPPTDREHDSIEGIGQFFIDPERK